MDQRSYVAYRRLCTNIGNVKLNRNLHTEKLLSHICLYSVSSFTTVTKRRTILFMVPDLWDILQFTNPTQERLATLLALKREKKWTSMSSDNPQHPSFTSLESKRLEEPVEDLAMYPLHSIRIQFFPLSVTLKHITSHHSHPFITYFFVSF